MTGIEIIAEERKRQIEKEGWTAEHDSEHSANDLAIAAGHYAMPEEARTFMLTEEGEYLPIFWPFDSKWWKPSPNDRVKELAKAGALIAAEIDRIQNKK